MKKLLAALILCLAFVLPNASYAEEARITDVVVTRSPAIKVSFQVRGAFTKEIEEAIKSGLPTSFNFIVELNKVNTVLPDEGVGRWEFKHTVKYDNLREEYEVSLDETGERGIRIKDTSEMKTLMSSGNGVLITPAHLVPGQEYEIKIMAELHTVDLPFLLNYMFFFVKFWDFETGWYTYRFLP